jgi:glycosyltransferase involved in cell wall biosynthesis
MPAYNAGKTVEKVFARIPQSVRVKLAGYIVVDDGSTDDTLEALMRVGQDFPDLLVLRHQENQGYGAAEKTLLRAALEKKAEIVILLHADGQYSPEKIPDLLKPIEQGKADLVQGSRMLEGGAVRGGMPLYKFVANKCLTALENLAFKLKMAEYHSGYMVYSRKVLLTIPFDKLSNTFDFDLEMIVAAKILGLRIQEVAIPTIYADEKSHLNPIQYGLDVLAVVRKYLNGTYHRLLDVPRSYRKGEAL